MQGAIAEAGIQSLFVRYCLRLDPRLRGDDVMFFMLSE